MTDECVRMHLAQALTRVDNPDAAAHIKAALNGYPTSESDTGLNQGHPWRAEYVKTDLECWLVRHATTGTPETVLVDILRTYADRIDALGYVPRSWGQGTTRQSSCPHTESSLQRDDDG